MKKKIIVIPVVILSLLLILALLAHTPPVKSWLLSYIIKQIETSTGAGISIESLDYNLIKWKFTFKKISLFNKETPHLPPFLEAAGINIDIPSPFSKGISLNLEHAEILQPEIRLIVQADGRNNFPFQDKGSEETPDTLPPFFFKHLEIKNARIKYNDVLEGLAADISSLDLTLLGDNQGKHLLHMDMKTRGTLRLKNGKVPLTNFSLEGELNGSRVVFRRCNLAAGTDSLDIKGTLDVTKLSAPKVNLALQGRLHSGPGSVFASGFTVPGGPLDGNLAFNAKLNGPLTAPRIELNAEIVNFPLEIPVSTLATGKTRLRFNGFTLNGLEGDGDFTFTSPRQTRETGKTLKKGPPLAGFLEVKTGPDGTTSARLEHIQLPGVTIDGVLKKTPAGLEGDLSFDAADIGQTVRALSVLLPGDVTAGINRVVLENGISGGNQIRVQLSGPVNSPQIKAQITGNLGMDKLKETGTLQLKGNVSYKGGDLRIDSLHLDLEHGKSSIRVSGAVPLTSGKSPISLNVRGQAVNPAVVASYVGGRLPVDTVDSRVSFDANVQVRPDSGTMEVWVEQLQITAVNQVLKNTAPFFVTMRPEGISTPGLELTGAGTRLQVNGGICFASKGGSSLSPLNIDAGINCQLLRAFLPSFSAEGTLYIKGSVNGHVAEPAVTAQVLLSGGKLLLPTLPAPVEDIHLDFRFSGKAGKEKVDIGQLAFNWNGCKVSMEGTVLPALSLSITARDISSGIIAPYLPGEWAEKVQGAMNLDFTLSGERLNVKHLKGAGSLFDFHAAVAGYQFKQNERARLVLENGWLILDKLIFTGPESVLAASGRLQLSSPYSLNTLLAGKVHAGIINHLWEDAVFSGSGLLNLHVDGNLENPGIKGDILLQDLGMQLDDYNLYFNGLNGTITWEKGVFNTPELLKGSLNGGTLEISGGTDWTFLFNGAKLDYPPGLISEATGTLTLVPQRLRPRLEGNIVLYGAVYGQDFDIGSRLYRYFRGSGGGLPEILEEETSEYLDFDIDIRTEPFLRVENNVSRAEVSAALKLTGTPLNPILAGRALIKEGSEIFLGKNTFYIDRGLVNFVNPRQLEPELDISARTSVGDTDIRLRLDGTPAALSASLTSTPPMPESQVVELLVSGKTRPAEGTATSLTNDTGTRVISYLAGALAGKVERSVRNTLGLDMVRIDGSLVASKENPGARLTVGTHLADNLQLIVSQSLVKSQDTTWIVNYKPAADIGLQWSRKDDNAYSLGALHEFRWGLQAKTPAGRKLSAHSKPPRIKKIVITGDLKIPERKIRKLLGLKKRKPFHFLKLQQGIQRIQKRFHRLGYLDVDITSRQEGQEEESNEKRKKTTVFLEINAGKVVVFEFRGAEIPDRIRQKIAAAWVKGRFDIRRVENLNRRLYDYLFSKKFYRAAVRVEPVNESMGKKTVAVTIDKGPVFKGLSFKYTGNGSFPVRRLNNLLKHPDVISSWLIRQQSAVRGLEGWYRQQGFLSVKVGLPEILWDEAAGHVTVVVPIEEGPRFRVGDIYMEGNLFLDGAVLENQLPIKKGGFYQPQKIKAAAPAVESFYAGKGFNNTRVRLNPVVRPEDALVDLHFTIAEYPRLRVKDIRILGNRITREGVIRRRLTFKPGDMIDYNAINKTRKKLYETNVFQWVNIEVKPLGEEQSAEERPCIVEVQVNELKSYRFQYGLQWDTETSLGLTGELSRSNFLGRAGLLGTSFRLDNLERDVRIFSRFPHFPTGTGTTEVYLFANHTKQTASSEAIERIGVTLQQQWRLARASLFSISYTFEKYRAQYSLNLAYLNTSLTYDTRDNLLEASRGLSLSQGFQYAGKWLGSRLNYFRYMGQFNVYKRLASRLVSATSVHLGLGSALGQALLPGSERFLAGGGTTLRGFQYNRVGPIDPDSGEPVGGEAMFLLREELRWKLFSRLGIVFFLDMGNVYPLMSDFDLSDLRKAGGIGLRYYVSGLVLRADWGFKLDRRAGESASEIFFSVGHTF